MWVGVITFQVSGEAAGGTPQVTRGSKVTSTPVGGDQGGEKRKRGVKRERGTGVGSEWVGLYTRQM